MSKKKPGAGYKVEPRPPGSPPIVQSSGTQTAGFTRGASVTQIEARTFPSAAELREYDQLVPGAAERFLKNLETEAAHRRELDQIQYKSIAKAVAASSVDRRLGLFLGAILGLTCLWAVVYCVLNGVDVKGLAAVVLAAGGLVWAVRRSTRDEPDPSQGIEKGR